MEDNVRLIQTLLERVVEYSKTSIELIKLKALAKASSVFSSLALHSIAFILIASSIFFINLGLALWLGDILGKSYYGFFLIGGFYVLIVLVIYIFMSKWLIRLTRNYIIKHLLK